jgi:hypothetical protein
MARYRNVNSGVVVSVGDNLTLDSEWEAQADSKPAPKKATAKSDSK